MRIFLALLIIALGWIMQGCTNETDRNAIRQMEQAAPLMQSDPEAAHVLLADSVAHPELLSPEVNARWCLMLCQLADSIGTPLPLMDDLDRARYYWERKGNSHKQALANYYLGRKLKEEKLIKPALKILLDAVKFCSEGNDIELLGFIYTYIAELYYEQYDFQLAKDKFLEAASYFEKAGNKRSKAFAKVNAAHMYAAMDSMQIAFAYMHQADSVLCALGDSSDLSTLYNNWGNIYAMQGELDIAKAYLQKSIAYCPEESAHTYSALGRLSLETDSIEQAEQYFEKAKGPTENPYTHTELYYHLSELEEKKGNINQALAYMRQYVDSTNADILARKETNLQEVETLFDRKQMMHENAKLHQKSKSIRSYLIGSLFLLLLLSVFYVYRLGRKNRRIIQLTDELQEQKSHLLEQQMALDSLSCQLKAVQQDNQEELRQKQSEYNQKAQEVELLKQQYIQQRQYLLQESTIYKKIQKSVSTPNPDHKELLTDKDWKAIYKCIDTMYPSLSERLVLAGITPTEKKYCYLSFFQLDSKQEAFLLNVNIDTPYKNRTRIRQKLKITGSEEKLYEHLALWG
ncbi:hypothetical protein NEE14_014555 [Parabacteroides sp. AD58]|uniref:Tetratricopeptide repeat protein n=1 Tax=Parabacteroides absconsus TaxID=2951805 RepID=A0ABZ2IJF8_9BACT